MPAIHSFDIGLIGCKVLNIRSVCVMLYLGNFPNSPTHKSMEKDCLITEAVFFVALLFYLCYNKDAIKDKTITFLLAEFPSLSGTQGRETGIGLYRNKTTTIRLLFFASRFYRKFCSLFGCQYMSNNSGIIKKIYFTQS